MIKVKNLTKFYGDHKAVDDLTFSIKDGTVCGFLGPNGAGKSTTMNIMTGCLSATSGTVSISGYDIFEEPVKAKKTIGFLPEQPPLYMEETPREYLRFVAEAKKIPREEVRSEVERVMEETQIQEVGDRLIKNLSKGYKQRVGIAQTLLGNPEVIILDEPTVGLNPIQVVEIRDLIKSLGKKHTVILSSHILSEVQNMCDEILIISKGKLIAYDTAENLEKMMAPKTTIEVLTDAEEEESREVISGIDGIEGAEYEPAENGLTRIRIETTPEEEFGIRKVLSLRLAKIERTVLKMDIVKANLEEIFLELTNPEDTAKDQLSGDISWAEIAESLSGITSDKMVEEPQALSVYGLDDPAYTLTVETEDTVYEISIGDESFSDDEVYISTGDDYVYLTNSELIDQISYSLLDCVQKEEIPEMETVNSVSVDKEEAVEIVYQEDAGYCYSDAYLYYLKDGEDYRNLDNDSTEEAVSAMTEFSWTECVDYYAEESELEDYGLDEPDASVTVSYTDEDGESGEFAYELGKSGEEYYAKLKDSPIIYTVEQEVYDAAVNASYEELKPDEVILLDWDTVESIEIEMDGSTYSIGVQSNGEDEYTYTFDDSEAEFGDALDELENISIDPEEEAELNDNKAELSLTIRRNTEEYSTVELDFYQHNSTYCIAVLDGEVTGCVAREDVVSLKEAVNAAVTSQ